MTSVTDMDMYKNAWIASIDAAKALSWKRVLEWAIPREAIEREGVLKQDALVWKEHELLKEGSGEEEEEEGGTRGKKRAVSLFSDPIAFVLRSAWAAGEEEEEEEECTQCKVAFSLFRRRHVCGSCSNVFCLPCCRHVQPEEEKEERRGRRRTSIGAINSLLQSQQRVCDRCFLDLTDKRVRTAFHVCV